VGILHGFVLITYTHNIQWRSTIFAHAIFDFLADAETLQAIGAARTANKFSPRHIDYMRASALAITSNFNGTLFPYFTMTFINTHQGMCDFMKYHIFDDPHGRLLV
jgi:hypothetical protein